MDDRRLISLGLSDQTVCQWKMSSIMEEGYQDKDAAKDEHQLKRKTGKIDIDDDSLLNEINFCYSDQSMTTMASQLEQFKDSTVLVRAANHATVNKILAKMHFDFEPKTWLKAPPMALVLEHIYGVQTADRRHSILYAHFSMNPEQLKAELSKTKTGVPQEALSVDPSLNSQLNIIMPHVLGTMSYQQIANEKIQKMIKYEVKHSVCSKALIYYTSRFGVIYNTVKSSQTFY